MASLCWVLGTFGLIPEGEREEEYSRQRLRLDEGHEAGPSLAHRKKWNKASMAGTQGVREGASGVVGGETWGR